MTTRTGRMSKSNIAAFQLVDPDGRISVSLDCARCGYDLRGRRLDDVCSECRASVMPSTYLAELRLTQPRAVRRIRLGFRLMQAACLLLIILPAVLCFGMDLGLLLAMVSLAAITIGFTIGSLLVTCAETALFASSVTMLVLECALLAASVLAIVRSITLGIPLGVTIIAVWVLAGVFTHFLAIVSMENFGDRNQLLAAPAARILRIARSATCGLATVLLLLTVGLIAPGGVFAAAVGVTVVFAAAYVLHWLVSALTLLAAGELRDAVRRPPDDHWLANRAPLD